MMNKVTEVQRDSQKILEKTIKMFLSPSFIGIIFPWCFENFKKKILKKSKDHISIETKLGKTSMPF